MHEHALLLVDSDTAHAGALREALRADGLPITTVANVDEAVSLVRAGGVELLLADFAVDGVADRLAGEARGKGVTLFEIADAFVGATNREIAIAAYGCADVFEKPVDVDTLRPWLRRVMGTPPRPASAAAAPAPLADPPFVAPAPLSPGAVTPAAVAIVDPAMLTAVPSEPQPLSTRRAVPPLAAETRPVEVVEPARTTLGVRVPETLDTRRVGAAGALEDVAFATVFGRAVRDRWTGCLRVVGDSETREVFFHGGQVVAARSDAADERLSAVLVSDGLLRADQLDAIVRNLGPAASEQFETYVDAGIVGDDDIDVLAESLLRRRVQRPFGWARGRYAFADGEAPSAAAAPLAGVETLWRAVCNEVPPAWMRSAVGPSMARPLVWVTQPPGRDTMRLTQWERGLLGSVDGETTADELVGSSRDEHLALALVYTLVVTGMAGFRA